MEKVYMQGSLFLKKGPEPISREDVEELRNLSYQVTGTEYLVEEGTMDYSYVDDIHQLIINENGMYLRRRDCIGVYENELIPITEEQLEEDYIDLLKFLKSAKYIGKYGTRTKETENGDRSYMDEQVLVLYQSPTHTIIYEKLLCEEKPIIGVLDSRFYENWDFDENQVDIYNDPAKLYIDLLKESYNMEENKNDKKK